MLGSNSSKGTSVFHHRSKISAKKKKKQIPRSYESGFEGTASIFFPVITFTLTLGVPSEILPLAKDCESEL